MSLTLLVLAGCSSSKLPTVKLATITPLSGGQSSLGTAISNGAKLAVKERKAELQAAGYNVQISPQDDQANPTVGSTVANRIAGDKDVLGVVGTLNSGVAKTVAPILNEVHVPMISPANTAVVLTSSGYANYNRVVAMDNDQGSGAARATINVIKAKTAYVLHDKTEYGQGFANEYVKEAKRIGLTVVNGDGEGINPADTDFSAVITKILAANPDVIFYGGIYDTASLLFKQADERGYKGYFLGGDGFDDETIAKNSGGAANRIYYTSVADNVYHTTAGAAFYERYKKEYKKDPPSYAIYGYDCANIMLEALIAYGKANNGKVPSRAEFEAAVRNTKGFKGLATDVDFDEKGDNPSALVYLFQIQNSTYPGAALGAIPK